MSIRLLGVAAVATALLAAAPGCAAAAVTTYTFTGLADGYGGLGEVLGFAGATFTDQAFTLTFRRDDATPGAQFYSDPAYSSIKGYGAVVPVTATLLLNGKTIEFGLGTGVVGQSQTDGATEGFQLFDNDSYNEVVSPGVVKFVGHLLAISASGGGTNYLPSSDYHTLPALTPGTTPLWTWSGQAEFSETTYNPSTHVTTSSKDNGKAYFRPLTMAIETSGAPEPNAWALMILGFGGAGAALRRRRPGFHGV